MVQRVDISSCVAERLCSSQPGVGFLYGLRTSNTVVTVLAACRSKDYSNSFPGEVHLLGVYKRVGETDDSVTVEQPDGDQPWIIVELSGAQGEQVKALLHPDTEISHKIVRPADIYSALSLLHLKSHVAIKQSLQSTISTFRTTCEKSQFKVQGESKYGDAKTVAQLIKTFGSSCGKVSCGGTAVDYIEFEIDGTKPHDSNNPEASPVLHIDCLALVSRSIPVSEIRAKLVAAVKRNLDLSDGFVGDQLQLFHFLPPSAGHPLTLAYPVTYDNEGNAERRKYLHEQFLLESDFPLFRKANALLNVESSWCRNYFLNIHMNVPPLKATGGSIHLVRGTYSYHHYLQDGFEDSNWGCAYRSLQTVFSWFRFQGFVNRGLPTHREIQECLAKLGDKPASFVGSRQWIGSTEVGYCLEQFVGVSSRILSAKNGAEMPTLARALAHHFDNEGTPVMIGGGQLAHTIVGVFFKPSTGEAHYLILDPHYKGASDNLTEIIKKGWCGWKQNKFWDQKCFYNLCLPQRPKDI